jgi:hypothetical protein
MDNNPCIIIHQYPSEPLLQQLGYTANNNGKQSTHFLSTTALEDAAAGILFSPLLPPPPGTWPANHHKETARVHSKGFILIRKTIVWLRMQSSLCMGYGMILWYSHG